MKTWTRGQIELKGWQFIPDEMAALGLTAEDGLTQAWFVDAQGRLTGGAEAINRSMRYCWWARPLTYLYFIPGLRQLQDRIYRWIADNRHRLPGSTDACEVK
ncbi:MAG: DCC1-like thiol-disulfide oxidoreductase family protein [Ardenticatenaceae bacterium]|nr:DCC1-like thiol-disulfide oxidoreductase family protein [Ardenticatenaceae bacterium]